MESLIIYLVRMADRDWCLACALAGQETPATGTKVAQAGDYGYHPWQDHKADYECPLCDECAENHVEPEGEE